MPAISKAERLGWASLAVVAFEFSGIPNYALSRISSNGDVAWIGQLSLLLIASGLAFSAARTGSRYWLIGAVVPLLLIAFWVYVVMHAQ
jgi:lipoprotein signal peptidase